MAIRVVIMMDVGGLQKINSPDALDEEDKLRDGGATEGGLEY